MQPGDDRTATTPQDPSEGSYFLKCHPDWMMCPVVPHDSLEVQVHI